MGVRVDDIIEAIKNWKLEIRDEDKLSIKFKYLRMLEEHIKSLENEKEQLRLLLQQEKSHNRTLAGEYLDCINSKREFCEKINLKV